MFHNNIFFNNFYKLLKTQTIKINNIITNLENIIRKKEKEILTKRKEFLAKLKEDTPIFKRDFTSSLCMGLFLGLSCIILTGIYGDPIDVKVEIMPQYLPEPEQLKIFKWYKPLKYDFPYKTYVGKVQLVIAWVFNDIVDVYNCPISGLAYGVSPDIYFNP